MHGHEFVHDGIPRAVHWIMAAVQHTVRCPIDLEKRHLDRARHYMYAMESHNQEDAPR